MLIGILLALIVVMVVIGVVTWIRRARSCQRIIDAPPGELELGCYGGVMCRVMMTGGTLVRLDLLDWGVRLRGVPLTRWYMPQWEARYEELAIAELVAMPHSRITVWFRVKAEPGGMGFMSYRSRDILEGLQKHDVPVNRSVQQIRNAAEMYGEQR
ncbi:MAG: hypothetical protein WBH47_00190 [Streptosporangiaceae bacterium]